MIERGYIGRDVPLLKRVLGLPGQRVCRNGAIITVDNVEMGNALERDRMGRDLPVWQGCRIIRDGELFLMNREVQDNFDEAAQWLEDGMNAYLEALNRERPQTWKHNRVEVDLTRSSVSFRIGRKKWQGALGGTDTLCFLMAYNYGLLSLSPRPQTHYPGLAIIDVPGKFSGEAIGDKENFIVQPFINLLKDDAFEGAQLIITGAAFIGLAGVHVQALTQVHVA